MYPVFVVSVYDLGVNILLYAVCGWHVVWKIGCVSCVGPFV